MKSPDSIRVKLLGGRLHARVVQEHSGSCRIREWVCPTTQYEKGRDQTGRINRQTGWACLTLRFRCNDPDCPAQAIISACELGKWMTEELETKR